MSRTPTCPACGAKFQHDNGRGCCRQCGIPDHILNAGPRAIARWTHKHVDQLPQTKRAAKSSKPRRNKHGRQGVKR